MYYINKVANGSGNHGNPVSNPYGDMVALPDELLAAYIDAKGFVYITTSNGMVDSVVINKEMYDAYMAECSNGITWVADRDYDSGEYIIIDETIYKVRLPIFEGSFIALGTNVEETTVEIELERIKELIHHNI